MLTDVKGLIERSTRMRRMSLASIYHAESGHPGGVLSAIDLVNYLLCEKSILKEDFKFILSKGHAAPAIYSAAIENNWVDKSELKKLRKLGSIFQGHPSVIETPWAETSTGSLGQGFSVSIGMAMGFKHQQKSTRVYVMIGDGELQEGEIWEGAMCAAHYKLNNLCAVVDYNKMQSDDLNENIINLEPLSDKWNSFNWNVIEIDGHDFDSIISAFNTVDKTLDKPTVIIAHTIKGKGVSFMENVPTWHGSVKISKDELARSLADLFTPDNEIQNFLKGNF